MRARCACNCGRRAAHRHHAIRAQTIRREGGNTKDPRWLVPMAMHCHFQHEHGPNWTLPASRLPDEVYEVAAETFGWGRAYNELRRFYSGTDPRLDALLSCHEDRNSAETRIPPVSGDAVA